jgi:hypothetical protein
MIGIQWGLNRYGHNGKPGVFPWEKVQAGYHGILRKVKRQPGIICH